MSTCASFFCSRARHGHGAFIDPHQCLGCREPCRYALPAKPRKEAPP